MDIFATRSLIDHQIQDAQTGTWLRLQGLAGADVGRAGQLIVVVSTASRSSIVDDLNQSQALTPSGATNLPFSWSTLQSLLAVCVLSNVLVTPSHQLWYIPGE